MGPRLPSAPKTPVSDWSTRAPSGNTSANWRRAFELYRKDDPETAGIRGRHLSTLLALTPWLMVANLVSGGLLGAAVVPISPRLFGAWGAALIIVVLLAMRAWQRSRHRTPGAASIRAAHRSTLHAAILGLLWGVVPLLWFPDAEPAAQLLIGTLTAGMMAAGAFALSPLPRASLVWVAILLLGALGALATSAHPLAVAVSLLLGAYAVICAIGAIASGHQATALLRSEREAFRQQELVRLLLRDFEEHATEALWELDSKGHLLHVSARLGQWLKREPDNLLGASMLDELEQRRAEGLEVLRAAMAEGRPFRKVVLHFGGAEEHWWSLSGKPTAGSEDQAPGWRGVAVDVTAEHLAQRRLVQLAHFDSVTGLANRVTLRERLDAMCAAGNSGTLFAVDLDHFKAINDSFGHSVGDAVLRLVGERLCARVRADDVVARLGGDEFAILVHRNLGADGTMALAQRLLAAFEEPCVVDGRRLQVGLSLGAVLVPEHGDQVEELMQRVDLALYEAKATGRGKAALYNNALGDRNRRRTLIETELYHAAERGELRLHWQPRVDLDSWRIVGAEALLRWRHPVLGEVSPAEFIPIAEQTGSIHTLGTWVLEEACRTGAVQLPELLLSVNVSTLQLRGDAFDRLVLDVLSRTGLPAHRLELELTESVFVEGVEETLACLRRLQVRGVRVALDDFGTGYSSLSYLRRFPFDTLKIDRSFIQEVTDQPDASALVGTMVAMAEALGMRAVAEGIETQEQLAQLGQLGCREIQGYFISRPVELSVLQKLLSDWGKRPTAPTIHSMERGLRAAQR
ncbi:MAG: EAL domain-containing protein [Deltaproteobacteria bacterium]|nr:EAL domain-containing protein [Deltaproteobacteria bacterium]